MSELQKYIQTAKCVEYLFDNVMYENIANKQKQRQPHYGSVVLRGTNNKIRDCLQICKGHTGPTIQNINLN